MQMGGASGVRGLERIRGRARQIARSRSWIYAVVRTLKYGPFFGVRRQSALRRQLLRQGTRERWRMLNLGSGGCRLRGVVNLDITPVTGPQVVGDGYALPFRDETFDVIFCEYVIEHVPDPESFLRAAGRTLKADGRLYLEAPFLQPGHDLPGDYTRWTRNGFVREMERAGLSVVRSGIHLGPAFTLVWIAKDFLAAVASLGIDRLHRIFRYALAWALSPLMLLDPWLIRLPQAEALASGYFFLAVRDD